MRDCTRNTSFRAKNCMRKTLNICLVLLLLLGTSAIVNRHDQADTRYRVNPSTIPALVYLPDEGEGTLIAQRWVLTAAHAVSMMRLLVQGKRKRRVSCFHLRRHLRGAQSECTCRWRAARSRRKAGRGDTANHVGKRRLGYRQTGVRQGHISMLRPQQIHFTKPF